MKHTNFSRIISIIFIILLLSGCSSVSRESESNGSVKEFSGVVKYVELEGGFWGIITTENVKYEPVNLEHKYRKEDLEVSGELKIVENTATIRMWGKPVEIIEIRRTDR